MRLCIWPVGGAQHDETSRLRSARSHSCGAAALQRGPLDRRGVLPRAPEGRLRGRRRLRDHDQRPRLGSRLVQLRGAKARAGDHRRRGRRGHADRQRRVRRERAREQKRVRSLQKKFLII